MNHLERRKEELRVACELQRELLHLEWSIVRYQLQKIRAPYQKIPQLWRWSAPVVGFWLARQFRRKGGDDSRSIWRVLWRLWRGIRWLWKLVR